MKAKDIIEKLSNDIAWVHRITNQFEYSRFWPYQTTDFRIFTEVTVRIPTGRQGRFSEYLQRRRMDAVAVIRVNDRRYKPILVGIEVKISASDLMCDRKIVDYLPYVDTFYLAVPDYLLDAANAYLKTDSRLSEIGVLQVGRCVETKKQAGEIRPQAHKRGKLVEELLMKSLWKEAEQKL